MPLELWLKAFAVKAGEKIRAERKRRGWSQKDLADRVGISQVAIMKIERGETTKSKFFPKIAQTLEIDLAELDPSLTHGSLVPMLKNKKTTSAGSPSVYRFEQEQLLGRNDLPVFSIAQGGPGALVLSNQPFRTIARPQNLQTIENAFGILIVGSSMSPEYREGDIAYVDPNLPPRVGDACLFQKEEHGTAEAAIKYLDKSPHHSEDVWHVRQQTPEKRFMLKKAEWPKCFVLVGKQSGR